MARRYTCEDAGGICRLVSVRHKRTKKLIGEYCRLWGTDEKKRLEKRAQED